MTRMKALTIGFIVPSFMAVAMFAGTVAAADEAPKDTAKTEVKVTEIRTTPGLVEPVDVLTLNTTVQNDSERVDGLVVEVAVKDHNGQTVQNMRQSNVGVDEEDDMAVYWVWRIPQRVDEGTYSVQVTVYEPDGTSVIDQSERREAFAVKKSERELAYAR